MRQVTIIALDGDESASGRALLCISALYHCSDRLHGVGLRLIDVADADVRLAAEALRWDVGLAVDVRIAGSTGNGSPLDGVSLYAGIVSGSARHMRLEEADRRHVPTMVAVQFPDEDEACPDFGLQADAAFDPKLFAVALVETAGRLEVPLDISLVGALVAPEWYRKTYADVAAANVDPVKHYFTYGWREGRNPNAWFATEWYLDQSPDLRQSDEPPLHHFVREGAFAGRRPHPDFDVAWYSRHQLGLDHADPEALRHFLAIGLASGCVPNGNLNRRAIRDRLPRQSATERSAVLKRLAGLQRDARDGKRWDDGEWELWPVLLAREVPEGRILVLVISGDAPEPVFHVARLLGQALPIQEFPLFAMIEGSHRLRIVDRLDDPQATLVLDLPGDIAGLRHLARALPVGRAVVTDDSLRHSDHVRWLRDAGIPVFINGPRDDADD